MCQFLGGLPVESYLGWVESYVVGRAFSVLSSRGGIPASRGKSSDENIFHKKKKKKKKR